MEIKEFDPKRALGAKLTEMDREELCEFISALCKRIMSEVGTRGRRGGIYPENISVDENGNIGIGAAGTGPWSVEELKYLAPEIYWNGNIGAASDVYSVGLLLYYGLTGKLPLEDQCSDAQLRRMNGDNITAPRVAGRRLGEIIEKALRFKSNERYQTLEELRVVIDSCVKNLYLSGIPSSEAVFKKNDAELTELERMMVGIIEKQADDSLPEENAAEPEPVEDEKEEVKLYAPQSRTAGAPRPSVRPSAPKAPGAVRTAVPKLTEEPDPAFSPIVPTRKVSVKHSGNTERERKIAEEVRKRRRRPLAVILVLCALLVIVAIVFNALLRDFQQAKEMPQSDVDGGLSAEASDPYGGTPLPMETPSQALVVGGQPGTDLGLPGEQLPVESALPPEHEKGYELVREDVSWIEARDACNLMGGHLVVISDEKEFNEIVRLAEELDVDKVWIGCHRIEGNLVWETAEVGYFRWGRGEPSEWDYNDNVAEDYVMLWRNNGAWTYNDNRNDPIADYPGMYAGQVAYICEFDG